MQFRSRRHDQRRRTRSRWDTWTPDARVLGVVRTLTSATRLLDVMPLLRPEDGIDVWYTVNPGSAFGAGLEEYLASVGARVLPWQEARWLARREEFHLAVACTVHHSMHALRIPLLVMPHGAGYNRIVAENTGDQVSPAGLSRRELTHRGQVVPTVIGLSHESELERLARYCPEAVPRAKVVGDWCYERIRASLARRDRYRSRLGVRHGQRLVVVNSTWSEHSLLGSHPDLPLKLVAALPVDEYAVAVVIHPNVWARHSPHTVLQRLEPAMHAGLRVIPPEEGWRAAIIAGDVVVGDHGSTTYYGAALDRVMLLAATGLAELDPDSPIAAFVRSTPSLDPDGDLYAQLLAATAAHTSGGHPTGGTAPAHTAAAPVPGAHGRTADGGFGARGESGRIVTEALYQPLARRGVRPSVADPDPPPVPDPTAVRRPGPMTFDVEGTVGADRTVALRRRPVVTRHHREARGFYAVDEAETLPLWPLSAEVLARGVTDAELSPEQWLAAALDRYPGLTVAVTALGEDRCLVGLRDGRLLEAHAPRPWGAPQRLLDPVLLGAAVNVWLTGSGDPAGLADGFTLRTGAHTAAVRFDPRPAADRT